MADLPFVGKVPGIQYYDYPNNRERLDVSMFGMTHTTLDLYTDNVEYEIHGGSQCQKDYLEGSMGPIALPPFAIYQGNETVDGVAVQKWYSDFFGALKITWYIDASDERHAVLKRYVSELPVLGETTFDYSDIQAGPQDDFLFDPSQWGCPPPVPPVTYVVSGYVTDAVTGRAISGVAVTLGSGDGTTTDSNGAYTFPGIAEGATVTIDFVVNGYTEDNITLTVDRNINRGSAADVALSPVLNSGEYRIVLTWGQFPADLDSHIITPGGCEVFFNRRSCTQGSNKAVLDRDATNGYGPETVTITYGDGEFNHFVYIYTNGGTFPNSKAEVKLYSADGLVKTLEVPTSGYDQSSRYWNTFKLTSAAGYEVINTVSTSHP